MTAHHKPGKLPPLAGLCTFDEAQRPGFSVNECVHRLKRYHYSLKRLHQVFNNRIPSEPVYELKMTFSLHAYYCAEHVARPTPASRRNAGTPAGPRDRAG
jgi:hypothetical protein